MPNGAALGRRACAVLAASSAVLHAFSLGHAESTWMLAVSVAMIGACLSCARDLWRRGTTRAWVLVACMNVAMVALHLPMAAGRHAAGLHHGPTGMPTAVPVAFPMALATVLAVVEVVAATAVLWQRSRVTAHQMLAGGT